MKLHDLIKETRIKKGLKQVDVADKIGISATSYQHYECQDTCNPRFDRLIEICEALDLKVEICQK